MGLTTTKPKKATPFDAFFAGADTGSKDKAFGGFLAAGGKVATGTNTGLDFNSLPGALKDGEALIKGLEQSGNTSSTSGDVSTNKAPVSLLPVGGDNAGRVQGDGQGAVESAVERHADLVAGTQNVVKAERVRISNNEEVRGDRLFLVSTFSDGTEEARDIGSAPVASRPQVNPNPYEAIEIMGASPEAVAAAKAPVVAPPSVAAPVAAPVATSNPAIEALQQSAQNIELPSNDELRANQMAQQAEFVSQADAAGLQAANGLNLQDFTQSTVGDRVLSPLEQMLETQSLARLGKKQFINPDSQRIAAAESFASGRLGKTGPILDTDSDLSKAAEKFSLDRLEQEAPLLDTDSDLSIAAESFAKDRLEQEAPLLDTDSDISSLIEKTVMDRLGNRSLLGSDASGSLEQDLRNRTQDRLNNENLLGDDSLAGRDAVARARNRANSGTLLGGDGPDSLARQAEAQISQRLLGGDSAQGQLERQRFEQRLQDSEREDMELLNRLGILRSGDSVEALTERNTRRDEGELGLAAFGETLRDQGINQALGFTNRRDALNLNEQNLQRGALQDLNTQANRLDQRSLTENQLQSSALADGRQQQARNDQRRLDESNQQRGALADASTAQARRDSMGLANEDLRQQAFQNVSNLQGRRDDLGLSNEQLRQQAFQNVSGLQGRRDNMGLANEDLRQQAFQNTLGLQGRRDDISRDNQNLQRAALADSANVVNARNNLDLNEANITGSLRGGATQDARRAQADQEFRRAGFQQDVTDRALSRLRGTQDVGQRERFEEDTRARLNAEGLANRADTRAGTALESDLFGRVADQNVQGGFRDTLSGRSADRADSAFDLNELLSRAGLTGQLDGESTLAGNADTRAGRQSTQDILNSIQGRSSQRSSDTRAREGLDDDLLTSGINRTNATNADIRAGSADTRAERGLTDDLLTSGVNRDMARDANTRADQTLEDLLFGTNTERRQGGEDVTRKTQSQIDRELNRDVAQDSIDRGALSDSRSERGLQSDLLSALQSRLSQRSSDTRADQSLEDILFGTSGDRRTESGLTNDVNRRNAQNADSRQAQTLEDLLFGTSTTQGGTRDTLRGEQNDRTDRGFEDDLLSAGLGRDATRAGLTGDFEGDRTLAGANADKANANARIVQLLAAVEAGTIQGDAATNAIKELLGLGENDGNPKDNTPQGTTATDDPNVRKGADGRTFIFIDGQWEDLGIQ